VNDADEKIQKMTTKANIMDMTENSEKTDMDAILLSQPNDILHD